MSWLNATELKTLLLRCNNFLSKDYSVLPSYKFIVDNSHLGFIRKDMVKIVSEYLEVFTVESNTETVSLVETLKSPKERTEAINNVLLKIKERNILPFLNKWRNENFSVYDRNRSKFYFDMERSGTGILGILRFSVHVTGYCVNNGVYSIWIAKRSMNKETHPGLLDNLVGGGCNADFSINENVIKECKEEAGIPDDLLENLKSSGCVSFIYADDRGVLPEVIYCYDLLLPSSFIPKNEDGEVESFCLMSVKEIGHLFGQPRFKYNSALVTLDFYFRHGLISPDECGEYFDLYQLMHQRIPID